MFTDIVILAGGFGERLWPASRPDFPKQFLSINDGISFLQNAIIRSLALKPTGKIVIATRDGLQNEIANQCNMLAEKVSKCDAEKIKNDVLILAEPVAKHTTAPVILSCHLLNMLDSNSNHSILVLTSDHIIEPVEKFVKDAEKAYLTAINNHFVCFGIKPNEPSTGYGYIQTGKAEDSENTIFKIDCFKEKPDLETAKSYLASGNCWWNSGMFAFTADFFIKELQKCTPEIATAFNNIPNGNKPSISNINSIPYVESWAEMNEAYEKTPAIAIDIAVAEKTDEAYIVLASFDWDDVGSWDSFEKHSKGEGHSELIQSNNCFVYSDIPVAICGVDDITVVIKNGKALVMKKGASPLVRDAVKLMK